jgi:hypothetical protein
MLGVALVSLAAHHAPGTAQFIVLDASPAGTSPREFLEKITSILPHPVTLAGNAELSQVMARLHGEFTARGLGDPAGGPSIYLFIHGLQRFKNLRYEEDFGISLDDTKAPNPGAQLNQLICEGTHLGFHILCACDTLNNANRLLSRKALSEFEMRVLFQMSPTDSASLIDSPKAATLGLHRALLYNSQAGTLETFRPYALPEPAWLEEVARHFARLLANIPS